MDGVPCDFRRSIQKVHLNISKLPEITCKFTIEIPKVDYRNIDNNNWPPPLLLVHAGTLTLVNPCDRYTSIVEIEQCRSRNFDFLLHRLGPALKVSIYTLSEVAAKGHNAVISPSNHEHIVAATKIVLPSGLLFHYCYTF